MFMTHNQVVTGSSRVSFVRKIPNTRLESRIIPKPQCFQYFQVYVKTKSRSQSKEG
jgi:hypothetical protein